MTQNTIIDSATKEYLGKKLSRFATKTDLKNQTKAIRTELLKLEERVENLEQLAQTLANDMKWVKDILIDIVGKLDDLRTENTVGAHQISELYEIAKNHERRIFNLEKSSQTT